MTTSPTLPYSLFQLWICVCFLLVFIKEDKLLTIAKSKGIASLSFANYGLLGLLNENE